MQRWFTILVLLCFPALAAAEDEKPKAPPVDAAIVKFVAHIQRDAQAEDASALLRYFDFEMLARVLEEAGYLTGLPEKRRNLARSKLVESMRRAVLMRTVIEPFEKHAIRSVKKGKRPDTFSVYVRLTDADGSFQKVRWHLVRRGASFKIFDLEYLDLGFGYVQIIGLVIVDALGGFGPELRGVGSKLLQAQTLLNQGKIDEAHELLIELEALDLPRVLGAFVQLALSGSTIARGEFDACLRHLDAVAELQPGVPLEQYMRATLGNAQGNHEAALKAIQRYIAMLDADAASNLELGIALHGLDRKPEALQALTPALKESPQDTDILAYFALSLPLARHGELAAHFDALDDKILGHRGAADVFLEHANAPLLRLFARLLAKTEPKHYDVDHYEGHALLIEEKYKEATVKLEAAQQAMFSAPEAERPADYEIQLTYMDAVMDAWLALDDPIQAHDRVLNEEYAFDYIADELVWTKRNGPLLHKYLAHVDKSHPDEWGELGPLKIAFYKSEADALEEKPKEARARLRTLHPKAEKAVVDNDYDDEFNQLLWDVEDRLVRVQIELKEFAAALALARKIDARDQDMLYIVMVHVLSGQAERAIAAITAAHESGGDLHRIFEDGDLAEALKGPAYAALRKELLGG